MPGFVLDFAAVKEVAVGQQIAVQARRMGQLPLVDFLALLVQQIDFATAAHGGIDDIAGAGPGFVPGGQPGGGHTAAGLLVEARHLSSFGIRPVAVYLIR